MILKSSKEARYPEAIIWECVLEVIGEIPKFSTYNAKQHRHVKEYTTLDLRYFWTLSLKGKKDSCMRAESESKGVRTCKGERKVNNFLGSS